MLKPLLILLALIQIIVGAIVLPMPIPLGAILMTLGIALLVAQSPFAASQFRRFRHRHLKFDGIVRKIEDRLPSWLAKVLRKTDP